MMQEAAISNKHVGTICFYVISPVRATFSYRAVNIQQFFVDSGWLCWNQHDYISGKGLCKTVWRPPVCGITVAQFLLPNQEKMKGNALLVCRV